MFVKYNQHFARVGEEDGLLAVKAAVDVNVADGCVEFVHILLITSLCMPPERPATIDVQHNPRALVIQTCLKRSIPERGYSLSSNLNRSSARRTGSMRLRKKRFVNPD